MKRRILLLLVLVLPTIAFSDQADPSSCWDAQSAQSLCKAAKDDCPVAIRRALHRLYPSNCAIPLMIKDLGTAGAEVVYQTGDRKIIETIDISSLAATRLARIGNPSVLPLLRSLVQEPHSGTGKKIFQALTATLAKLQDYQADKEAFGLMLELVQNEQKVFRAFGVALIGQYGLDHPVSEQTVDLIVDTFLRELINEAESKDYCRNCVFLSDSEPEIDIQVALAKILSKAQSERAALALAKWACSGKRLGNAKEYEAALKDSLQNMTIPAFLDVLEGPHNRHCSNDFLDVLISFDFSGVSDEYRKKLMSLAERKDALGKYALFATRTLQPYPPEAIALLRDQIRNSYQSRNKEERDAFFLVWIEVMKSRNVGLVTPEDRQLFDEAKEILHTKVALFHNSDEQKKSLIAQEFGKWLLPFPQVIQALMEALGNDSSSKVKAAAAEALGRLKAKEAIPTLEKALQDKDAEVVRQSRLALRRIRQ